MIIWWRNPVATVMPTRHTEKTQRESHAHDSSSPVSIASAGIGATSPAEETAAAEEQADWLMLFSSTPNSLTLPRVIPSRAFQKA
jgi:hypothetical protein